MPKNTKKQTPAERVKAFLDECADAGKSVPTIATIRETCGVAQNSIRAIVDEWKTEREQTQTHELAKSIDDVVSDATRVAWGIMCAQIAGDYKQAKERMQKQYDERTNAVSKEMQSLVDELKTRTKHAEEKADTLLVEKAMLSKELETEKSARVSAERERDELRQSFQDATKQLESLQDKLKELEERNALLDPDLFAHGKVR